jgi:hypothetical protein
MECRVLFMVHVKSRHQTAGEHSLHKKTANGSFENVEKVKIFGKDNKNKLRGLNPLANYTDRAAAAACRRS